jgi:hypothetical protein
MQEVTRLVSVDVYDGMKFELQKNLSHQFGVAHSLTLGSTVSQAYYVRKLPAYECSQ